MGACAPSALFPPFQLERKYNIVKKTNGEVKKKKKKKFGWRTKQAGIYSRPGNISKEPAAAAAGEMCSALEVGEGGGVRV